MWACQVETVFTRGLQGPPILGPPGAARALQRFPGPRGQVPPEALQSLKMWGVTAEGFCPRVWGIPGFKGKMYIVYIWPTGVAGGRAVPPDVREEPGGALYVHSPFRVSRPFTEEKLFPGSGKTYVLVRFLRWTARLQSRRLFGPLMVGHLLLPTPRRS